VTPAQPPPPAPGVLAADYLRRADQLFQQENFDAAYATANEGLQVDPSNSGLQSLKQRIEAARRLLARRSSMPSVTAGELPAAAADGRAAESPQERNRKAAIRSKPSLVARVSGTVWVDVTVDTQGNVVRAQAVSGPPELKQAAVDAARQSKFRPATREGVPVSDRLTLPYMFSARN
jgi:TonB family protein